MSFKGERDWGRFTRVWVEPPKEKGSKVFTLWGQVGDGKPILLEQETSTYRLASSALSKGAREVRFDFDLSIIEELNGER